MSRTFPAYNPQYLKLTPEQEARVPAGSKIHFGINRVKQKNGDIYVTERAYYIDSKTNNPRAIASVKFGKIPRGATEVILDRKFVKPPRSRFMEQVTGRTQQALSDERQPGKVRFPLEAFWAACILCAMTGRTDARSIADYWNANRKALFKGFDNICDEDISPDTVRRLMSLLTTEQAIVLTRVFSKNADAGMPADGNAPVGAPTVVAIDGQSVRASRINGDRCGHILNLYNCSDDSFMGQCLIESKQNEVSGTPGLLEPYDLDGTIVTADALFTKSTMFNAILAKGADYCIPVKDNAKVVKEAIDGVFTRVMKADPDDEFLPKIKWIQYEKELAHGRFERREVYVLPGSLLPKDLRDRWVGLEDGCIVQYLTSRFDKKEGTESTEIKRVVSSVRWDSENVAAVLGWAIRRHWAIENELHWELDVAFRQDRIQCKNGKYLYARTWLNKTALTMLKNYKKAVKSDKSIERLMVEMHSLAAALKCLKLNFA